MQAQIGMEYDRVGLDWHGVRQSGFRLAWSTIESIRLAWSTIEWVQIGMEYDRVGLDWHGERQSLRLAWSTIEWVYRIGMEYERLFRFHGVRKRVQIGMEYDRVSLDWHGVRQTGLRLAWSTISPGLDWHGVRQSVLDWHGVRERVLDWHGVRQSRFRLAWSTIEWFRLAWSQRSSRLRLACTIESHSQIGMEYDRIRSQIGMEYERVGLDWHGVRPEWVYAIGMEYDADFNPIQIGMILHTNKLSSIY